MSFNSINSIQDRVFELIAENEDIDALLEECVPGISPGFTSSTWISPSVNGVFSMLENQCAAADCSLPVLSASVLGSRVKKLVHTSAEKQLLSENQRLHLNVVIEVCQLLCSQNNFNQKLFAKLINKDIILPLEVIWKLDTESVMSLDLFITSNLSCPAVIGGLAQSISQLCLTKMGEEEEGASCLELRSCIVTDLIVSLIGLAQGTEIAEDFVTKGVKKVSSALLDSITKKLMQLKEARNVNIFELLLAKRQKVDKSLMKKYFARQLSVMLSSTATFKVSDALRQQNLWTFGQMDIFVRSVYENILTVFESSEVFDIMTRLLDLNEVNWKSLLSFVSVLLFCYSDARKLFLDFVGNLLKDALNSLNLDKIITAFLLGRQGCLEGPHVFMVYQDWFQKMFGDSSSSLATNRKSFSFLVKFLTDIVPHDPVNYLKIHIQKPPFIPSKCRHLWSDYSAIVKTRLIDLKEFSDETSICGDASGSTDAVSNAQVENDIERAVSVFEKTGKLPQSILEISIFKRSYFLGKFIPTLLQPRPIPAIPDARMKFISALCRAKKITDVQYATYEEQCKGATNQLMEGFFDENDDETVSVEAKLQQSLDAFRDALLQDHCEKTVVLQQLALVSDKLLLATKADVSEIIVECPQIVIDTDEAKLDPINLKIAQIILNWTGSMWMLKGSASLDCDASWLSHFLQMLLRHHTILQSICTVILHLLTIHWASLASCHVAGIAAILAHFSVSKTFSGCLVYSTKEGNRQPFLPQLFNLLPMSSYESLCFSLELSVAFLEICCSKLLNREEGNDDILSFVASSDGELKASVFNTPVLQIILFAAPRLYCQLRHTSASFNLPKPDSTSEDRVLTGLSKLFSFEQFKRFLQQNEMTFRDWARLEMNVASDKSTTLCERLAYYDWVVFIRRYPHSDGQFDLREEDAYVDICCATLVDIVIEMDVNKKLVREKHPHAETQEKSKTMEENCTTLLPLIQKLVHVGSRNDNQKCYHWLWKVFKDRYRTDHNDNFKTKINRENCVSAFHQILLWLPSSVLVPRCTSKLPNATSLHSSVNEVIWFVNEVARNHINIGLSLPPSLLCHLLRAFSSHQAVSNEEIKRFLKECPLIKSSVILNWDVVSYVKPDSHSDGPLMLFFKEIESVINAAKTTMEDKVTEVRSSLWTTLALLSVIKKEKSTLVNLSHVNSETKSALYNCLIAQYSSAILHCSAEAVPLQEIVLLLCDPTLDHLQITTTEFDQKIELCASDAVGNILPLVHVYAFNLANRKQPVLALRKSCCQNFNSVIANYNKVTEQYKSCSGEQWLLFDEPAVDILREAVIGITDFIKSMSSDQLKQLDSVIVSESDLEIQKTYHKRRLCY